MSDIVLLVGTGVALLVGTIAALLFAVGYFDFGRVKPRLLSTALFSGLDKLDALVPGRECTAEVYVAGQIDGSEVQH